MNREKEDKFVIETMDEEKQRKILLAKLQRLFRDGGYLPYYDELKHYKLDIDKDPESAPGYIDTDNKVIHIREDVLREGSDGDISLLMRHELLHGLLRHISRTIKFYARELGINPRSITRKDLRLIKRKMTKELASQSIWSNPVGFNIAGDAHLSQYYDEIDKALTRDPQSKLFSALVIDDYPQWVGKTYEDILRNIIAEENRLRYRLATKVHGKYIDEQNFEIDYEEKSEFETATEVSKEDLLGITMWDVDSFERDSDKIAKISDALPNWCVVEFSEDDQPNWKTIPVANIAKGKIVDTAVKGANWVPILPIFRVRYLSFYKNLQESGYIECCGLPCVKLDYNRLIAVNSPVSGTISTSSDVCVGFDEAPVKKSFEKWKEDVLK